MLRPAIAESLGCLCITRRCFGRPGFSPKRAYSRAYAKSRALRLGKSPAICYSGTPFGSGSNPSAGRWLEIWRHTGEGAGALPCQFQHAVPQSPASCRRSRRPLRRNRLSPQCGHFTGPPYSARIHTFPERSSMPVIWYPGRPSTASDLIKRILPRMFYQAPVCPNQRSRAASCSYFSGACRNSSPGAGGQLLFQLSQRILNRITKFVVEIPGFQKLRASSRLVAEGPISFSSSFQYQSVNRHCAGLG
jgi:hypothetical protein